MEKGKPVRDTEYCVYVDKKVEVEKQGKNCQKWFSVIQTAGVEGCKIHPLRVYDMEIKPRTIWRAVG